MRRPVGVIVSCIILGFGTLILLLVSALFLFLSTMMGRIPFPTQPGQPTPDPAVMSGVMIGIGIVCLIPTAWAGITLVGLARMKNWARYSIIVIGSGLVFFSLLGLLGTILSQTLLATTQQGTGQSPAMLRVGMIVNAMTFFVIMGVGIWWIAYFILRRTRDAFTLAAAPLAAAVPSYIPPSSPYAASSYEVASYIPAPDPNDTNAPNNPNEQPPVLSPVVMLDQSVAAPLTGRPLTITIIAVLAFMGLVFMLPYAFLPFPLFLFGVELTGWSAHLLMAGFAMAAGLTGMGLWRLKKFGLYTAYVYFGLGVLNCASFLLPSVRAHMFAYQQHIIQTNPMVTPQAAAFQSQLTNAIMMPMMIFAAAFCLTLLILVFSNRAAFERTEVPPTQAADL